MTATSKTFLLKWLAEDDKVFGDFTEADKSLVPFFYRNLNFLMLNWLCYYFVELG